MTTRKLLYWIIGVAVGTLMAAKCNSSFLESMTFGFLTCTMASIIEYMTRK